MTNNTASSGSKSRTRGASKPATAGARSRNKATNTAAAAPAVTGLGKAAKARIATLKKQITMANQVGETLTKAVRDHQAMIDTLTAERATLELA